MASAFDLSTPELIIREVYGPTGSQILQLTSSPAINSNIYGEVPYMDPTSRYIMFLRRFDSVGPAYLYRIDMERRLVTKVTEEGSAMRGFGVSPDQGAFWYIDQRTETAYDIVRTDFETLEQRRWSFEGGPRPRTMGSLTPDERYFINSAYLGDKRFAILRFDLQENRREVIWEQGEDMCNAHPQLEPGQGRDLLIQHNRGAILDDYGRTILLVGEIGGTLFLIDIEGGNHRTLPVGKPHTPRIQGHETWIGKTGEILLTVGGDREQLSAEGNLLAVRPGDEAARVVAKGAYFDHPNASRDGRFFVSDTSPDAQIIVGSIQTGKWGVLCESGASLSVPQYTHPHPYLSPDNGWVIYSSDRTGVPQVYAAQVPEGFLEELERA
jgi:Tol biopolymer transport system component